MMEPIHQPVLAQDAACRRPRPTKPRKGRQWCALIRTSQRSRSPDPAVGGAITLRCRPVTFSTIFFASAQGPAPRYADPKAGCPWRIIFHIFQ